MDALSYGKALPTVTEVYTDFAGLRNLGKGEDKQAGLKKVAQQFESMFVNMMLKSMRQANAVFEEGSLFQSSESKFYRDMHDQQLSLTLAHGNGLGIAEAMYRQMSRQYGVNNQAEVNLNEATPMERKPETYVLEPQRGVEQEPQRGVEQQPQRGVEQQPQRGVEQQPQRGVEQQRSVEKQQVDRRSQQDREFRSGSLSPPQAQIPKQAIPVQASTTEPMQEQQSATRQALASSPLGFLEKIKPLLLNAAKTLGVDPDILGAQAALETGWGQHMLATPDGNLSHNLFNIKKNSSWQGDSLPVFTLEEKAGVLENARAEFKVYKNLSESVADYVKLLTHSDRYKNALNAAGDSLTYVRELQQAGYATDSRYADKVFSVYQRIKDMVDQ